MTAFVYIGKHKQAALYLPTRTVQVARGEEFEVDDDEAAILNDTPGYEPVEVETPASEPEEGDED